jgi:hypothetical protein
MLLAMNEGSGVLVRAPVRGHARSAPALRRRSRQGRDGAKQAWRTDVRGPAGAAEHAFRRAKRSWLVLIFSAAGGKGLREGEAAVWAVPRCSRNRRWAALLENPQRFPRSTAPTGGPIGGCRWVRESLHPASGVRRPTRARQSNGAAGDQTGPLAWRVTSRVRERTGRGLSEAHSRLNFPIVCASRPRSDAGLAVAARR